VFEKVINSRWFNRSTLLLFLNKIDVIADKFIRKVPSPDPEYDVCCKYTSLNDATKHIYHLYRQRNQQNLPIYPQ
jgi:guanine nucleotide-binding protein subunit alpha